MREFEFWLIGSLLLGVGTAMVYPSLIAAVSDASQVFCQSTLFRKCSWKRPHKSDPTHEGSQKFICGKGKALSMKGRFNAALACTRAATTIPR
jgi:hypothetical protein